MHFLYLKPWLWFKNIYAYLDVIDASHTISTVDKRDFKINTNFGLT